MPKKASRKVAARQAELSKKKKKGKPNVSNVYIPSDNKTSISGIAIESPEGTQQEVNASGSGSVRTTSPSQAATRKEKVAASAMAAYSYVGPEVRRIAIVTALMLAIVIALTFVLK